MAASRGIALATCPAVALLVTDVDRRVNNPGHAYLCISVDEDERCVETLQRCTYMCRFIFIDRAQLWGFVAKPKLP